MMKPRLTIALIDWSWGGDHPTYFTHFAAAMAEARRFFVEVKPHRRYEGAKKRLPLGCRKWTKHGLDLWRPFNSAEGPGSSSKQGSRR